MKSCECDRETYEGRIILDFTDHLSDRDLYNLIEDILPTSVKRVDLPDNYFHQLQRCGRAPECSLAIGTNLLWIH